MNEQTKPRLRLNLFFLFVLAAVSKLAAVLARDVDDMIREVQIRDLLADNQWYDLTLPGVAMPEPYVSPWSRLVDLPYYLITKLLQPVVGVEQALIIAKFSTPLLLLTVFGILFLRIVKNISGNSVSYIGLALAALAMTPALGEFAANRIDHHNFQIGFMMLMAVGLVSRWHHAGFLIGLAAIGSVVVGLEALPFIIFAIAGLTFGAIAGNDNCNEKLKKTGLALVILSLPFAMAFIGPDGIKSIQCDAYSRPWIVGALLGGLTLVGLTSLWSRTEKRNGGKIAIRAAMAAISGIVLAVILAKLFPSCLDGPYQIIDPVTRQYWLQDISQEQSLTFIPGHGSPVLLIFFWIYAGITIAAGFHINSLYKNNNYGAIVIYALGIFGLILMGGNMRYYRFPAIFLSVFVPLIFAGMLKWKLSDFSNTGSSRVLYSRFAPAFIPVFLAAVLIVLLPAEPTPQKAHASMAQNTCENADLSVLARATPGKIIAPIGVSQTLFEKQDRHTVAALPQHRSAPGMRRIFHAFLGFGDEVRKQAFAPFDYVGVCLPASDVLAIQTGFETADAPLYLTLLRGEPWPGLTPVEPGSDNLFKLYEIDHSKLK